MDKVPYIANKLNLPIKGVEVALSLFAEGQTVPFIARYRREVTGNLSDENLRDIQDQEKKYDALTERKETVLGTIEKLGKLTPSLKAQIDECDDLAALEDIYRPYKPKRETRGSKAREAGLDRLLDYIMHDRDNSVKEVAKGYISEKYKTVEDCIQGALDIWAENMSDDASVRHCAMFEIQRGRIAVTAVKDRPNQVFDNYDGLSLSVRDIKAHQVMAIARGEKQKCLRKSFVFDEEGAIDTISKRVCPAGFIHKNYLDMTVKDACQRLIFPSVENEVWNGLLDKAKSESLNIFASGVKEILMAPPLKPETVMGYDPGYTHGCKLSVISPEGKVLDTAVIHPRFDGSQADVAAQSIVSRLIQKYDIKAIALGNGTASRESMDLLKNLLRGKNIDVPVYIVSESGASIYSTTETAQAEFPDYDYNLRSSISIARRLLDPMAELVKIPPESLGVGQYQHDLDQKKLKEHLSDVVEDCVSNVGVDLNTASPQLLEHISGLNKKTAKILVDYREKNGKFDSRKELEKISGFGPKAYQNSVGFLRIKGTEPLDDTSIHPESYEVARKIIAELNVKDREQAKQLEQALHEKDLESLALKVGSDKYTVKQILEELAVPHRDPRGEFMAPHYLDSVREVKDLKVGMVVEGTVRNIVAYGAYIDIGIHKDGLLHVSEISDRRVDNPAKVLHIGQIVKVMVTDVDVNRNRFGLSLKQAKDKEIG